MKKLFLTSTIALFMLAGCNTTGTDDETSQEERKNRVEQTRYNDGNMDNRNKGENNRRMTNDRDMNERNTDDRYDVSKEAADAITREISEVDGAYVITMGDRAYVAAMFDDDRSGETNERNNNQGDRNPNTNNNNRDRTNEDNRELNRTDDGMQESDQLTDDLKKRIADVVQDIDNSIKDVYVTTNPEFSNLARDYADDVDKGEPIEGFFDQIGNMIERVFPQNKR